MTSSAPENSCEHLNIPEEVLDLPLKPAEPKDLDPMEPWHLCTLETLEIYPHLLSNPLEFLELPPKHTDEERPQMAQKAPLEPEQQNHHMDHLQLLKPDQNHHHLDFSYSRTPGTWTSGRTPQPPLEPLRLLEFVLTCETQDLLQRPCWTSCNSLGTPGIWSETPSSPNDKPLHLPLGTSWDLEQNPLWYHL